MAHQGPSPSQRSIFKTICLIGTCTFALASSVMNSTGVSVSLPTIGRDLNIPQGELQWLISAYSLTSGCLLILFGRLADIYGRRRAFVLGTVWMLVFSIACAVAKTSVSLDILRAMQGIGSAAMVPAAFGILAHSFPPSHTRAIAFATFSAGAPIGAGIGYVVSGLLTQLTTTSWRAFFYLSAGINVIPILGAYLSIDPDVPSEEDDTRVDWIGAFLVTAGLVLIVFVLSAGEDAPQGWKTAYIIVCLILGVIFFCAFLFWQSFLENAQVGERNRAAWMPPPLVKLSLFSRARGRMAVMMAVAFLNWCCFISWTFWMTLYYQDYVGLTPVKMVLRILPMIITGLICNGIVILIVSHVPVVYIIVGMTALTGIAPVLFATIKPSAPYWAFGFPAMVLSVAGADFVMATGSIFVAKVSLPHEQSLAGALFQTMTQIGTAFGLTITTAYMIGYQGRKPVAMLLMRGYPLRRSWLDIERRSGGLWRLLSYRSHWRLLS